MYSRTTDESYEQLQIDFGQYPAEDGDIPEPGTMLLIGTSSPSLGPEHDRCTRSAKWSLGVTRTATGKQPGHDYHYIVMPEDHMDELYRSSNPLVRFVHVNRLDRIVRAIPSGDALAVLDAGCGEGHLIERMHRANANSTFFGVDVTEIALVKARQRCPYAVLERGDLEALRLPDASFDVVTCSQVLEHVRGYREAVAELMRVLRPGGALLITFPNDALWTVARFLLRRVPVRVPDHVNTFDPGRMERLVGRRPDLQVNLPFGFPFAVSLVCLMRFRK